MAQNTNKTTGAGNDGNGFKTAAFGFDKNDVTMYIATLRKKMKAMEEEYEQKLSEAVITARNATDSSAAVADKAASDVEKEYQEKLTQREGTIMELQRKVERLEADAEAKNAVIDSLKKRVKDDSSSPVNTVSYLDEAQELLNAAFVHLDDVAKSSENLRSKLVKQQSFINEKMKLSPKKEKRSLDDVKLSTIDNIMADSYKEQDNEPLNATFSSNEDDGIMASIEIAPEIPAPAVTTSAPAPAEAPAAAPAPAYEEPINSISAEFDSLLADDDVKPAEPEKPGSMSENFDFDLNSLLADDEPEDKNLTVQEIDLKAEKGDDLGDDLYEMLIDGNESGDLSSMLAEQDIENKQEELNSSVSPNLDIDPEFLVGDEKGEFDSLLAGDDDASGDDLSASFPVSDSDQVFDFAFSDTKDENDDDDMSTDL